MMDPRTEVEILASLRAASDTEVAVTLLVFARAYARAVGERCLVAEVAAERLLARPA